MIAVSACFPRETRWFSVPANVSVIRTLMGARAPRAIESWVTRSGKPSVLIATGFAGGVDRSLTTGDLVIAESVLFRGEEIRIDLSLLDRAQQALAESRMPTATGAFLSVDSVASPEEKGAAEARGAIALDMESGPLAEWAWHAEVPFLAVRAVLDPTDLPVVFSGNQPIWIGILRHPWATVNLARRSKVAGQRLGRALEILTAVLGEEGS